MQFDVVCSDDGAPVIFSGIGGGSSSDNGFLLSFGTDNGRVLGFSLTQAVIPASESCKQASSLPLFLSLAILVIVAVLESHGECVLDFAGLFWYSCSPGSTWARE